MKVDNKKDDLFEFEIGTENILIDEALINNSKYKSNFDVLDVYKSQSFK